MKKIGFFGGCFNPPSNIHINLAKELVINKIVDEVIFVPVGNYYKKQNLIEAKHRYNMLRLACKDYPYLDVEDIAVKSESTLYATDTFELINEKYKNIAEIYLIMGSDNFIKISTWKKYENIIEKYKYIVIERPNYKEKINNRNNVIYYNLQQEEDISATKIRHLLKNKDDTRRYLNDKVIKYIEDNQLYK